MLPFACLATVLLGCQLLLPLKIKRSGKLLLWGVIALFAMKFQIIHIFGGGIYFAPDLPGWLLLTGAFGYGVVFFSFFMLLVPTAAAVAVWIFCRLKKRSYDKFRKIHNIVNLFVLCCAVVLSSLALYNARKMPEVRQITLTFPQLAPAAENYRITVLADLHIDRASSPERVSKLVEKVNSLQSNIIVILGDTVDGVVERQYQSVKVLANLRAADGVYGIMGNHEYFSGGQKWADFLADCQIKMLLNSNIRLKENFYLAGITDPAAGRAKSAGELPDLNKALLGITKNDFTVLLAHRPGHALKAAEKNVQLQLSGHTHGGMVWGFDRLVGRFNENFISGLYQVKNMLLYVSNGSAIWSGFPFRLGRDSEITVITLKDKKE
ncbi:MAG: metallophosphoesterase [Lentisphaeria bacterium]|nr:metallophosphoesterase [Lentisphaeria bacterium]